MSDIVGIKLKFHYLFENTTFKISWERSKIPLKRMLAKELRTIIINCLKRVNIQF